MGAGPVTFNYAAWQAQFPTFASVSEPFALGCFNEAGFFCDNTANSPVNDPAMLLNLLNLLTCHICWLTCPQLNGVPNDTSGTAPPALVGRISDASEGSVSVRTELAGLAANAQWYAQTQWGLMYWTKSTMFRMALYVPGPPPAVPGQGWGVAPYGTFGAFRGRLPWP